MVTFTTHQVALPDGGHLAYVDPNPGTPGPITEPAVVLLHGGVLDHRMWTPQLEAWTAEHRVVAVDARGHGWSSTATGPHRHCDDLAVLLRELDLAPAALVGISQGGGIAVDVALEHPDLVSRLVVSGVGTSEPDFTDPWTIELMGRWAAAAERGDKPGWVDVFLELSPGPQRTVDDLDPALMALLRAMAEHTVAEHIPEGPPILPTPVTHTWERLADLAVPVLAVPGLLDSSDHIAMCERLAASVPDGRVVPVEGASHYPNLERPQAWEAAVLPFLAAGSATSR